MTIRHSPPVPPINCRGSDYNVLRPSDAPVPETVEVNGTTLVVLGLSRVHPIAPERRDGDL